MISINATLFIQIIHFLILVFILNRLMLRPILKLIDERDQYIRDLKKEVVKLEEETTELIDKCVSIEKTAKQDAVVERSQLKEEAVEIAEKIFSGTREEVALIRDKAEEKVDEQLKNAQQYLQSEAMILAEEITGRVIDRRIAN